MLRASNSLNYRLKLMLLLPCLLLLIVCTSPTATKPLAGQSQDTLSRILPLKMLDSQLLLGEAAAAARFASRFAFMILLLLLEMLLCLFVFHRFASTRIIAVMSIIIS